MLILEHGNYVASIRFLKRAWPRKNDQRPLGTENSETVENLAPSTVGSLPGWLLPERKRWEEKGRPTVCIDHAWTTHGPRLPDHTYQGEEENEKCRQSKPLAEACKIAH